MKPLAREGAFLVEESPSPEQLDAWAQGLADICRVATLDLAFEVGQFVIAHLFGGDSAIWDKEGTRRWSYRALASRGDLPLSASALCRAVGVYVLVAQLGGRERWQHLSASHFQEVLPVLPEKRAALLLDAETGRWSVARLRVEAKRHKASSSDALRSSAARSLRSVALGLTKHREVLGRIESETLRVDSRLRLHDAMHAIQTALTKIENVQALEAERPARPQSDISELGPGPRGRSNAR